MKANSENVYFDFLDSYESLTHQGTVLKNRLISSFRDVIKVGNEKSSFKVFLLCNFVYHRRTTESQEDYLAKVTHPSVIRLVLSSIAEACGSKPIDVTIGNSPLQSASWLHIVEGSQLLNLVDEFNDHRPGFSVRLRDLRMNVQPRSLRELRQQSYVSDETDDVLSIDLKKDSMLEFLEGEQDNYRVLDYPVNRIRRMHGKDRHIYLIHREILDSDLIVSIPKLKTHEKVGLTAAIKGCVGTVAHKDSLAHHRFGAPENGGDEYPRVNFLRALQMTFHHWIYSLPLTRRTWMLREFDRALRKLFFFHSGIANGSWRGNDTAWRMSIDLARITLFGCSDGTMATKPVRHHFSVTDGIIAGEGQGPLNPTPVSFGWLAFAQNIAYADIANALVMGFAGDELPIVHQALKSHKWPLVESGSTCRFIGPDARRYDAAGLADLFARKFVLPGGW